MNTTKLLHYTLILLLCFTFHFSFSSPGNGSVMGQVTDPETKQPVSDANVIFESLGSVHTFMTNEHGYYYASNLPTGVYKVTASFMSNHSQVSVITVGSDDQLELNIAMGKSIEIPDVPIVFERRPPLIDPLKPEVQYLDRTDIAKLPVTTIADLNQFQTGMIEVNGVYYVKGAREGSLVYYLDGSLVMGNPDIPLCGLDAYTTYTGFIPVKYGNSTGGVVVMETRNYFSEAH